MRTGQGEMLKLKEAMRLKLLADPPERDAWSQPQTSRRTSSCLKQDAHCDIFPGHLFHVLLCHHCICVHFRWVLGSQVKRCLYTCRHTGLHRLPTAHISHMGSGAELLLPSLIHDQRFVRIVQQHSTLACFKQ